MHRHSSTLSRRGSTSHPRGLQRCTGITATQQAGQHISSSHAPTVHMHRLTQQEGQHLILAGGIGAQATTQLSRRGSAHLILAGGNGAQVSQVNEGLSQASMQLVDCTSLLTIAHVTQQVITMVSSLFVMFIRVYIHIFAFMFVNGQQVSLRKHMHSSLTLNLATWIVAIIRNWHRQIVGA